MIICIWIMDAWWCMYGTTYFLLFSRTLKAHLRTPITQKGKALSADQPIHTARAEMWKGFICLSYQLTSTPDIFSRTIKDIVSRNSIVIKRSTFGWNTTQLWASTLHYFSVLLIFEGMHIKYWNQLWYGLINVLLFLNVLSLSLSFFIFLQNIDRPKCVTMR